MLATNKTLLALFLLSPGPLALSNQSKSSITKKTNENKNPSMSISRRNILSSILPIALASASLLSNPQPSAAKDDEIFKCNPLTNRFDEKIRILEQDELIIMQRLIVIL